MVYPKCKACCQLTWHILRNSKKYVVDQAKPKLCHISIILDVISIDLKCLWLPKTAKFFILVIIYNIVSLGNERTIRNKRLNTKLVVIPKITTSILQILLLRSGKICIDHTHITSPNFALLVKINIYHWCILYPIALFKPVQGCIVHYWACEY